MPARDDMLAAIRADPDDDAPRLIYADWLLEHGAGDDDRRLGELIQIECRLAKLPREHTDRAALDQRLRVLEPSRPLWMIAISERGFVARMSVDLLSDDTRLAQTLALPLELWYLRISGERPAALAAILADAGAARLKAIELFGERDTVMDGQLEAIVGANLPHLQELMVWGTASSAAWRTLIASDAGARLTRIRVADRTWLPVELGADPRVEAIVPLELRPDAQILPPVAIPMPSPDPLPPDFFHTTNPTRPFSGLVGPRATWPVRLVTLLVLLGIAGLVGWLVWRR
jgi:uncharacterized protein (TIGR02996 family)